METSRTTLLALAELTRRRHAAIPGVPEDEALTPFELKVFSQNGEDGVLAELLRRAGDGGRFFVEFGAGAGYENSCAVLADVHGWSGLFIEGHPERAARLGAKYAGTTVRCRNDIVTAHNIDDLLASSGVPVEPDVMSIDVDGPDYWIWQAMERHRPRIVVIEYNATLGLEERLVQPPTLDDAFDRTDYGGASIAALRELGTRKGYRLVHTELTGTNAFFVREDLPGVYPSGDAVPLRPPNHFLRGAESYPDPRRRRYVTPPAA